MTDAQRQRAQAAIDIAQGKADTKCPWHLIDYTRKDIGDGLTIKVCESCRLNKPMHNYAPRAGRVR